MPLFAHQNMKRRKPKGPSIASKIKHAFHRTPNMVGPHEGLEFIDKFRIMFLRSMIVLMAGVSWWVAAPAIFISLLPGFQVYVQTLTNARYSISSVYLFWQVVPEILLFSFSIIWTSGVLDMIVGNEPLKKVF